MYLFIQYINYILIYLDFIKTIDTMIKKKIKSFNLYLNKKKQDQILIKYLQFLYFIIMIMIFNIKFIKNNNS